MKTEYEIVFREIDREEVIKKISLLWWKIIKKNTLMKRIVFYNPLSKKEGTYLRVRNEWDKVTCTYKEILPWKLDINSVKELEVEVSDYDGMVNIFKALWLKQKSYQESYRETWAIEDEVYFMIDLWPWLKPFIEIEWNSEEIVKKYSIELWFDYQKWLFGAVDQVYFEELWIQHDYINSLESITFDNVPRKI